MKTCMNCGKKFEGDAKFCSNCLSHELSDYAPSPDSNHEKSSLALIFAILGLVLPSICIISYISVISLNILLDVSAIILGLLLVGTIIGIFILAIIAAIFPILDPIMFALAVPLFFIAILLFIVTLFSSIFSLSVASITQPLLIGLSVVTLVVSLVGISFSTVAVAKKNRLGIAGIIVSSLSIISVILLTLVIILTSTFVATGFSAIFVIFSILASTAAI